MISGSSLLNTLFLYTATLFAIWLLRKWTGFLKNGGVAVLLLMSAFATVRLILPFEIPITHAFRSWDLLGAALRFFLDHPDLTQFLLTAWAVGAVVFVGLNVFILWHSYRQCRKYTVVESESVQELARRMSIPCPVVVSPDVPIPYVMGFFRHTIYLPVLDFSEESIGFILAHEAQHIRTHDALIKLFFGLVTVVMWWNPAAHLFRGTIDALLEFRCDAKVTEGMDEEKRYAYVNMLKDLAKRLVPGSRGPVLALNESLAVGRESVLTQRGKVILRGNANPPRPVHMMVQFVLLVLFCASYLIIWQPAIAPHTEELQNDSNHNYLENYDDAVGGEEANNVFIIRGADGRYQLFVNYKFVRFLSEGEVASDEYQQLLLFFEEGE